jgi:hypothetical protein
MSQNDIRSLEDMNAIESGDRYFVPLNMIPTDKVDEYYEKPEIPATIIEEPPKNEDNEQGE